MARCPDCNACRSQWDIGPCPYCAKNPASLSSAGDDAQIAPRIDVVTAPILDGAQGGVAIDDIRSEMKEICSIIINDSGGKELAIQWLELQKQESVNDNDILLIETIIATIQGVH